MVALKKPQSDKDVSAGLLSEIQYWILVNFSILKTFEEVMMSNWCPNWILPPITTDYHQNQSLKKI